MIGQGTSSTSPSTKLRVDTLSSIAWRVALLLHLAMFLGRSLGRRSCHLRSLLHIGTLRDFLDAKHAKVHFFDLPAILILNLVFLLLKLLIPITTRRSATVLAFFK